MQVNYYSSSEGDDLKYTQVPASPPSLLTGFTPSRLRVCGDGAMPLLVGNLLSAQMSELPENIITHLLRLGGEN